MACSPCPKARGYRPRRCEEWPPLFAITSCLIEGTNLDQSCDQRDHVFSICIQTLYRYTMSVSLQFEKATQFVESVVGKG